MINEALALLNVERTSSKRLPLAPVFIPFRKTLLFSSEVRAVGNPSLLAISIVAPLIPCIKFLSIDS